MTIMKPMTCQIAVHCQSVETALGVYPTYVRLMGSCQSIELGIGERGPSVLHPGPALEAELHRS